MSLFEEIEIEADRLGKLYDWTTEERNAVIDLARRCAETAQTVVIL